MDYGAKQAQSERALTLNERLNKVSEALQFQCERIESVLAKVNGSPQPGRPPTTAVAQINPTLPLATVVDHIEAVQARLADLATHAERIA